MAFVNEYIPEADYEKYDLKRICGDHNKVHKGHMYSESWTIDRERDAFLIPIWFHRESDFSGYAFYWKGDWMFFEMRVVEGKSDRATRSCWYVFCVRRFCLAISQNQISENLLDCLRAAITQLPGGVNFDYANRIVTVEFEGE